MKAMILAAGLGTRMLPLTEHTPKPLLPLGKSTIIEHHLVNLAQAGIREVVINTAHLAEKIEQHLGNGQAYGLSIQYSRELQPLETAGGIRKALPLLGEQPFIIINGDVWTDYPLNHLIAEAENFKDRLAHIVLVENPEHNRQGDFLLSSKGLVENKKKNSENEIISNNKESQNYTYSGINVLSPKIFSELKTSEGKTFESHLLADYFKQGANEGRVTGSIYKGKWVDIGTPERLERLREEVFEA